MLTIDDLFEEAVGNKLKVYINTGYYYEIRRNVAVK